MFGSLRQSPLKRVAVHIAQLLDLLAGAPYVEIIETHLLNRFPDLLPQDTLFDRSLLSLPVHLSRETLLDHLHHHRRVTHLGLRDEQMKVLRHDHISVDDKAVLAARLFQDFQKYVAAPR